MKTRTILSRLRSLSDMRQCFLLVECLYGACFSVRKKGNLPGPPSCNPPSRIPRCARVLYRDSIARATSGIASQEAGESLQGLDTLFVRGRDRAQDNCQKPKMPKTTARKQKCSRQMPARGPLVRWFIVLETGNRVKSCFCVSKHSIVRIQCGHATCAVFARVCLEATRTQLKQQARDQ